MAKTKPTPLVLPVGEDLAKTLQFAYAAHAYALYGLQVDQIKIESDPGLMEVPEDNTLVWMQGDVPAPTMTDLSNAYVDYQASIATPLDVRGFESGVYNDPDLQEALMRVNPIAFTILMRLLDGLDLNNPGFTPVQAAVTQVRGSMSPDFTTAQINRLTELARVNGLNIKF